MYEIGGVAVKGIDAPSANGAARTQAIQRFGLDVLHDEIIA